jgi:large-conductance mechanosensitive channel
MELTTFTTTLDFTEFDRLLESYDDGNADLEDLESEIVKKTDEIFKILTISILDGSYIDEAYNTIITDLTNQLKRKEEELSIVYKLPTTYIFIGNYCGANFFQPLFSSLESLLRFLSNIQQKSEFHEKRFYLDESFKNSLPFWDTHHDNESCKLFNCNLFIANCDHFVTTTDKDVLEKLEEVIIYLDGEISKHEIYKLLYSKALFIRNKYILRAVEEYTTSNHDHQIYISRSGGAELFQPSFYIDSIELTAFKNWNEYLINHYQINSNWEREIRINPDTALSGLSLLDLHKQIKYYKDVLKNFQALSEIGDELNRRLVATRLTTNKFDVYALKICLSYCYNNQFSLMAENHHTTEEQLELFYQKIKHLTGLSQIKNYFIAAKYIKFKRKKLEEYFEQEIVFDKLEECRKLLDDCDVLKVEFYERINWVKINYNYVFQLTKSECYVDVIGSELSKIFVFSSCFLPINRNSLELHLKADLEKLKIFRASISKLKITYKATKKIENLTSQLDESQREFAKKDSKNLEILALFAAIVTFTAGTIPGFKFINTGIEAIFFTLSLGTSMALFALVFYAINRGQTTLRTLKWPIVIWFLIIIVLWTFLFIKPVEYFNETKEKEGSTEKQRKVDQKTTKKDSLEIIIKKP